MTKESAVLMPGLSQSGHRGEKRADGREFGLRGHASLATEVWDEKHYAHEIGEFDPLHIV
jgi:hypothetical protein